jgi:hypothetical protein
MGKSVEDVTTPAATRLPLYSLVDHFLAEAAYRVMPEVGSRGLVTCILITPNASCLAFAFLCSTSKEVGDAALVYLDLYFRLEEGVYGGSPSLLGRRCELK